MDNETGVQASLHTLIPLADFKAVLGLDDREDKISVFCLITATFTIEQYCLRRFFTKKHFERIAYNGDLVLPLREYPVREVLAVYAHCHDAEPELVKPELYAILPEPEPEGEEWAGLDIPHTLRLSPAIGRLPGLMAFKVIYRAGYGCGEVPPDLASACLELAVWNMSRYRGRRVGITGNVRGSGKDGEHLEASMPENVRLLLDPYRRRVI
ncbi:MAG: hypothetical protein LBD18_03440 [Treponema sp.]|jgi:hypothetical protein|nr:hypothetical protein [Treponema sp.]